MRLKEHLSSADIEEGEDPEDQDETKRAVVVGMVHLRGLDALIEDA